MACLNVAGLEYCSLQGAGREGSLLWEQAGQEGQLSYGRTRALRSTSLHA